MDRNRRRSAPAELCQSANIGLAGLHLLTVRIQCCFSFALGKECVHYCLKETSVASVVMHFSGKSALY